MELGPHMSGHEGSVDKMLSALVGPGVIVSRSLFGVHNVGFFVLAPLLNFAFWSAISYVSIAGYGRFSRNNR